jgi:hypothetical protein
MIGLLKRASSIPVDPMAEAKGLKYDLYWSQAKGITSWGLTLCDLYEEGLFLDVVRLWLERHLPPEQSDILLSLSDLEEEGLGYVLALGGREGRSQSKYKLYLQERSWGSSHMDRQKLLALAVSLGIALPAWIGTAGVAGLSVHPDGQTELKLYLGFNDVLPGNLPSEAAALLGRLERLSPLDGDVHRYLTVRLFPGQVATYSANKIYNAQRLGFHSTAADQRAAWADVAALFGGAGQGESFRAIRRKLLGQRGLLVLPTASAIDAGGGADVYFTAWDQGMLSG